MYRAADIDRRPGDGSSALDIAARRDHGVQLVREGSAMAPRLSRRSMSDGESGPGYRIAESSEGSGIDAQRGSPALAVSEEARVFYSTTTRSIGETVAEKESANLDQDETGVSRLGQPVAVKARSEPEASQESGSSAVAVCDEGNDRAMVHGDGPRISENWSGDGVDHRLAHGSGDPEAGRW
jgi:hypothetical protein